MSARVYLATFPSLKNPVHVLFCVVFLGFAVARGAPDAEPTAAPFTAQEIAQGFREHVIVARPLPGRRAIAAAEEAREGVRVRETFARFGELRVIDLDATDTAGAAITRLQATAMTSPSLPAAAREVTDRSMAFERTRLGFAGFTSGTASSA